MYWRVLGHEPLAKTDFYWRTNKTNASRLLLSLLYFTTPSTSTPFSFSTSITPRTVARRAMAADDGAERGGQGVTMANRGSNSDGA